MAQQNDQTSEFVSRIVAVQPRLRAYIRMMIFNPSDVGDILQESVAAGWEHYNTYTEEGKYPRNPNPDNGQQAHHGGNAAGKGRGGGGKGKGAKGAKGKGGKGAKGKGKGKVFASSHENEILTN